MLAKIAAGNVRRSIKDFSVFFLTLMVGVCVFYAFDSIKYQTAVLSLTNDQRTSAETMLALIDAMSVFVAAVLGFLVVYANRFLIGRRKREFGIYLTLGMGRAQVARIIVMETLFVGVLALAAGLAAGVLLSQLLLYVSARLFSTTVEGFAFLFSAASCAKTIACFAAIFAVSLVFDVALVSKYRLVDLIYGEKRSEKVRLRSVPVCAACFVVALALIGVAYYLLVRGGMMGLGPDFYWACGLVSVGTALLFFSASGFLLLTARANKGFYLRGLNMFVLRQIAARVNTAWVSISMVCAMLFLAMCGICTGFSVAHAMNSLIEHGIAYDISLSGVSVGEASRQTADQYGGDALAALEANVAGWDQMVQDAAQVRLYLAQDGEKAFTLGDIYETTTYTRDDATVALGFQTSGSPVNLVRASDYNALRALCGQDPVDLGDDGCLVWCDNQAFDAFWKAFFDQHDSIDVLARELRPRDTLATEAMLNYLGSSSYATFVVPDSLIDGAGLESWIVYVDVNYSAPREEVDQKFRQAVDDYMAQLTYAGQDGEKTASSWPVSTTYSALELRDQSTGMSVVMSYLAAYVGLILLISCASVLALQQLSEASNNASRYRVLSQLGADPRDVRRALLAQIGFYFLFPLVVALAHATCALYVVNDTLASLLGNVATSSFVVTGAFVAVLYGGYFLLTYKTSKDVILRLG